MIAHHPDEALLFTFAAGSLDEGERLLIATHVSLCAQCAATARGFECIGGALLEAESPTALAPGALQAALARIGAEEPLPAIRSRPQVEASLPAPVAARRLGPWRRLAPRVRLRRIEIEAASPTRAFLLEAAPGTTMLPHEHTELEWTCVLQGAFGEGEATFSRGDFDAAGADDYHRVRTKPGDTCVCLVAMRGQLRWRGPFGPLANLIFRL